MSADNELYGRDTILRDIADERFAQDSKWGGAAHDDTHSRHDWIDLIDHHLDRCIGLVNNHDHVGYRKQLIRVAALAVAAVESFDRKNNAEQK
jgi:beta-xylosidase